MATTIVHDTPAAKLVQQFIDRVVGGDLPGALEILGPDCVFDDEMSLPWGGSWVGPEGFAALLMKIGQDCVLEIVSADILGGEDFAVVKVGAAFTSTATGRRLETRTIEHYTVRDGVIVHCDVYYKDTQQVSELLAEQPSR